MEITLSLYHFLSAGVLLLVLAIAIQGVLQIKAMLDTLTSIQLRLSTGSKRLENTRNHVEAAEADINEISETLGLVERPTDKSSEFAGAGITMDLAEFKNALALFKQ